jgi:hypothetical protein
MGLFSYENKVRHKLDHEEGVGGYLFLSDVYNLKTVESYERIKHISEFLLDLDGWKSGIGDDWKKHSRAYILKYEADIDWLDMDDGDKQQMSGNGKSIEITKVAFLYTLEACLKECLDKETQLVARDNYYFLRLRISIPPERIKFIKY